MESPTWDAIVLGAGHNGLVCANYLARAGLKVRVVERRSLAGGACVTEELFPGFHFSACSYICYLLQAKVIDDLELRRHGLEILPIDPLRFLPLPDGRRLLIWNDVGATQEEIARFSRRDAAAYPGWVRFWERAAGLMYPYFLQEPPTLEEVADRLRGTADGEFLERLLVASMVDVVEEFFESGPVRAAFIHAHDAGDPALPGSAWSYAYIKCSGFSRPEDVGLPRGGMGAITRALVRSGEARGLEVQTGAVVERVEVGEGRAIGVRLEGGEVLRSRVVISNADPKRTFLKLVEERHLDARFRERVARLRTEAAYFKFHAALRDVPDFSRYFQEGALRFDPKMLAEVKICPSVDYFRQAWADARRGEPSAHPVMEVQMPSAYDPTVAPAGRHLLSVWALYAPSRLRAGTWGERRQGVGENLIRVLSEYAPNLRECLVDWSLFTPADMEERMALTGGNIRHLDLVPGQLLAQRPMGGWAHYRTPVAGLYLCGAGTHPGGEVTGAPGHNAALAVLRDLATR